ncbi:LrgB family protein [Brevibacillus fluminis]|uniref:LrgB family protein n=1 Tax=Brevibacillus fluminis TaxID=511487 RepID=UPI003F8C6A17
MLLLKICSVCFTVALYLYCKRLNRKKPGWLTSPIILTPLAMMGILFTIGLPYEEYQHATSLFTEALNMVTVAFAIPLYRNWAILRANWRVIVFSLSVGSLAAIIGGMIPTYLLGMGGQAVLSVIPRSITTPIAVSLSESIHGIPALTAVFVMLTSFAGMYLGPKIMRLFHVRHPLAIGMMYGMGAHALGTVKAFERGEVEGTVSSLSNIVGAIITVAWAFMLLPIVSAWMS